MKERKKTATACPTPERAQPGLSATQVVVDHVRSAIRHGVLGPGEQVRELQLAKACSVSRSAIREALRTLEAEGTLVRRPGHSAVVRQFSLQEIWAQHQIREVLEGLAAGLAAGRSDQVADHAELIRIGQQLAEHAACCETDLYLQANHRFHCHIMKMSGNPLIEKQLDSAHTTQMRMQAARFMNPDGMARSMDEHRVIIAAILEGDSAAADAAMRKHIRGSRKVFLELPDALFRAKSY